MHTVIDPIDIAAQILANLLEKASQEFDRERCSRYSLEPYLRALKDRLTGTHDPGPAYWLKIRERLSPFASLEQGRLSCRALMVGSNSVSLGLLARVTQAKLGLEQAQRFAAIARPQDARKDLLLAKWVYD
jgi:hypothetical protein